MQQIAFFSSNHTWVVNIQRLHEITTDLYWVLIRQPFSSKVVEQAAKPYTWADAISTPNLFLPPRSISQGLKFGCLQHTSPHPPAAAFWRVKACNWGAAMFPFPSDMMEESCLRSSMLSFILEGVKPPLLVFVFVLRFGILVGNLIFNFLLFSCCGKQVLVSLACKKPLTPANFGELKILKLEY